MKEYRCKKMEMRDEYIPGPDDYTGLNRLQVKIKTTTNPYILAHRQREQERMESINIERLKK